MTFVLTIDCDNAAFEVDKYETVADMLEDVARRLRRGDDFSNGYRSLFDVNGNEVGRAAFKGVVNVESGNQRCTGKARGVMRVMQCKLVHGHAGKCRVNG